MLTLRTPIRLPIFPVARAEDPAPSSSILSSVLPGFESIFDLTGERSRQRIADIAREVEKEGVEDHWRAVGEDIWSAIRTAQLSESDDSRASL
jgi:hypothetical protein